EFAPPPQLLVEALQHAQSELAVAFDGDDAGVGETVVSVAFELDALLEVDEVELDLVGRTPEGEVADDDVEEGRFPRAGLACDEGMLAGALAEGEVLALRRAAASDGHSQLVGGGEAPKFLRR